MRFVCGDAAGLPGTRGARLDVSLRDRPADPAPHAERDYRNQEKPGSVFASAADRTTWARVRSDGREEGDYDQGVRRSLILVAVVALMATAAIYVVRLMLNDETTTASRSPGAGRCVTSAVPRLSSRIDDTMDAAGDFDGDGRADRFSLYRGARPWSWRLRMKLGSGATVDSAAGDSAVGQPLYYGVISVVDVQGDGSDEVLVNAGGNTAGYAAILTLDGCRIRAAQWGGRRADFLYFGTGAGWLQGGPNGGIACEDVTGDSGRELTVYQRGRGESRVGAWYRLAYRLDGTRLTRVQTRRVADQASFAIVMDGVECAAPGPVRDGVYVGEVDEIDRTARRARFDIRCEQGVPSPAAPPITVSLDGASFRLPSGDGPSKHGGFEQWAALGLSSAHEMATWLRFKRHPGRRHSPMTPWRFVVRDGHASHVAPSPSTASPGCS